MNKRIYQGHFIRKRFGQQFLTNQYIINSIVTLFDPKPDQAIIEIGPGLGALTLPICKQIKNMIAIELDRDLVARLVTNSTLKSKLTIIQSDALTIDFSSIAKEKGKSIRVFGNIPYNISTPLMFHLFSFADTITDMNFMLQKEVVNRLVAKPNTKSYGRLSIMAQYYCHITPILDVPALAFTPTPKVDSAVVRFIPHKQNPYPLCDVELLTFITTKAFSQRRKTIYNSLNKLFSVQDLVELDINPTYRAENISIENYCNLACKLAKKVQSDRNKLLRVLYVK